MIIKNIDSELRLLEFKYWLCHLIAMKLNFSGPFSHTLLNNGDYNSYFIRLLELNRCVHENKVKSGI